MIMLFFEKRKMFYTFSDIHGSDILHLEHNLNENFINSDYK